MLAQLVLATAFAVALQGCSTSEPFRDDAAGWQQRFRADFPNKDKTAAARDLTVIAARWPDRISQYSDVEIAYLFNGGGYTPAEPQVQFDLLRQLYAAHWTWRCGVQPSPFWLKFVELLVDRGDLKLARDVVRLIRGSRDVLILRVDKRYATIAAADPSFPTVEQAAIQNIDAARAAVQRCPRRMSETVRLLQAMLVAGHDDDVLEVAAECLDRLARNPHSYDDATLYLNSLLDERASAFVALGRWTEAEQAYGLAVRVNEYGRPNVSQRLNFADFLIRMGRVNDTESDLAAAKFAVNFQTDRFQGVSQYGALVFAQVKLQEALRLNDHAAEELTFAYIKKHRETSHSLYRYALLLTHRTDEYARALIADLRDPLRRADTLVGLQNYKDLPKPPGSIDLGPETKAAMQRPEVQQAIREVGSIQSFDVFDAYW